MGPEINQKGWSLADFQGIHVMRFSLLAQAGVPHGMVVRNGQDIDTTGVYQRLAQNRELVTTRQTHGPYIADADGDSQALFPDAVTADGLMTGRAGRMIAIHVADCVPVLLSSGEGSAVALVHAGWRGTAQGIVRQAVERFCGRYRLNHGQLLGVIGPAIEFECYQVGPEVAGQFSPEVKKPDSDNRWLLDLKSENRRQLIDAGLHQERIHTSELCTRCRSDLFHSYRREGAGLKGQMIVFIEVSHE